MKNIDIKKLQTLLKALSFLIIFLPLSSLAQQNTINHTLVSNFNADGKVLKVSTPDNWSPQYVLIGWKRTDEKSLVQQYFIDKGSTVINLNKNPLWGGDIAFVGTNANVLNAAIIPKTLSHSLNFFMEPNYLIPGSINFDTGYNFGDIPFSNILLGLFVVCSLLLFFLPKKSFYTALFVGFLISWYALDLRQIKNQIDINAKFASDNHQLSPFYGFDEFYSNCESSIGEGPWKLVALPGVFNSYAKYKLAEIPMVARRKRSERKPNFLITTNPENHEILLQNQGIHLVRIK